HSQICELSLPDADAGVLLNLEVDLPFQNPDGDELPVIVPIKEVAAWRILHLAFEERHEIVAVEMDLEGLAAGRIAGQAFLDDLWLASRGAEGRDEVIMREDFVVDGPRLDDSRPADQHRYAISALPIGCFFAAERRVAAVGPAHHLGAVVGGVDDD